MFLPLLKFFPNLVKYFRLPKNFSWLWKNFWSDRFFAVALVKIFSSPAFPEARVFFLSVVLVLWAMSCSVCCPVTKHSLLDCPHSGFWYLVYRGSWDRVCEVSFDDSLVLMIPIFDPVSPHIIHGEIYIY